VISHLLTEDWQLAGLHGHLEPATDRPLLSSALARQIAKLGGGDPCASSLPRADRLAARLLPDILEFNPSRPGGFTFAAMNGRKPDDAIDPIVRTILAGAPRRGDATKRYAARDPVSLFRHHRRRLISEANHVPPF
jgi:hypothetical protein